MKRGEWISGRLFVPAHKGVYERLYEGVSGGEFIRYAYWDGCKWSMYDWTPKCARYLKHTTAPCQDLPFRGLVKD